MYDLIFTVYGIYMCVPLKCKIVYLRGCKRIIVYVFVSVWLCTCVHVNFHLFGVLGSSVTCHHDCFCSVFSSPYDGKWSKSMVGYGPEDNHFVVELTYNYGIGSYRLGNDFKVGSVTCSISLSEGNHCLSSMTKHIPSAPASNICYHVNDSESHWQRFFYILDLLFLVLLQF